ncbi:PWWP domain containing protein [Coccidioides posadasii C735 delta SOWgp]|uniref:PWWP domain containing protein n=1 Tax=Coccidioides posadasii (strain C735) TaxID=222929 RepID=C5P2Q4_COCP7|nr:PWWP domain containing protein [Coccidioides posadasii C735 delta SOWgp]EER28592.1 PWWP domain containing protein [Coccidioides posadasii C735 delta SOWgp]|eukprot:XP_003070737.1 PWWP domain containing protein [Coccidioides posadasii C735 delta SOWgp]
MAEEGNPAVPKTADSKDEVPQTAETTAKSPELSQADQDVQKPSKEGDDVAGHDQVAAPAEGKPEKTDTTSLETAEIAKPTESGSQEPGATSDNAEARTGADDQATGANGTPTSAKKSSKRKSIGVPEHRSKKMSKKKAVAPTTHLDAQPGEYYFARLRSWPPWPAIICDEEMLPQSLLATRPITTKQSDGTYTEHFKDGAKRVNERTFPVMFLHTNEFAWIPNTDLVPLDPEQCKNPEKAKGKGLLAAYQVASEGHDLQHFKDMLADHQRALQEDEEAREARAKAKQDKKKRKSMDLADEREDVEMADVGAEKPKATKKRKKDVESEGESDKPVKTPKTATKLKLTTPKAPASSETGKKGATAKATKSKGPGGRKAKQPPPASDEEEAEEAPKEPEPKVNPAEAKAKREKEIFYLRHRLQKGFLSRDQVPKEREMEAMSSYISRLDSYDDLEISIIRKTKISKVLKGIIKLADIPKESEYNFRGRSIDILKKWKHWDAPATEREGDKTSAENKAKPAANGVRDEMNGKGSSKDDVAAPDTDEAMPDADADESEKKAEEKEPTSSTAEEKIETEPMAA